LYNKNNPPPKIIMLCPDISPDKNPKSKSKKDLFKHIPVSSDFIIVDHSTEFGLDGVLNLSKVFNVIFFYYYKT
jgi:hypothetical protein